MVFPVENSHKKTETRLVHALSAKFICKQNIAISIYNVV